MAAVRAVGLLLLAGIALAAILFLLSGDRRYLRWALTLLKLLVALGLVFFGVLLTDRLL